MPKRRIAEPNTGTARSFVSRSAVLAATVMLESPLCKSFAGKTLAWRVESRAEKTESKTTTNRDRIGPGQKSEGKRETTER